MDAALVELDLQADAAYRAMLAHWAACDWCEGQGAELAPLEALCGTGRTVRLAWERAERRLGAEAA